jgi:hypothetical protein
VAPKLHRHWCPTDVAYRGIYLATITWPIEAAKTGGVMRAVIVRKRRLGHGPARCAAIVPVIAEMTLDLLAYRRLFCVRLMTRKSRRTLFWGRGLCLRHDASLSQVRVRPLPSSTRLQNRRSEDVRCSLGLAVWRIGRARSARLLCLSLMVAGMRQLHLDHREVSASCFLISYSSSGGKVGKKIEVLMGEVRFN